MKSFTTFAADAPKNPIKPGKWECVTKEDTANLESAIPRGQRDSACKISDVKVEGSTVSWKLNCEERHMTGDGKVTYEADAYAGEMHGKTADREMTMKYNRQASRRVRRG